MSLSTGAFSSKKTLLQNVILDEDDMDSNSNVALATQQSIKKYVDDNGGGGAQDLDFQGDSGGNLSIDLDTETLTLAGGTGIDSVGSGSTVTFAIDGTVATLTGSQVLTSKTINGAALSGTLSGTPTFSGIGTHSSLDVFNAGISVKGGSLSAGFIDFYEDSDNGTNKVKLIGPTSTGDVTCTLPDGTCTLIGRETIDTLTNKTLTSPTITGTGAIAGTFTGNLTGSSVSCTGNAATATKIASITNSDIVQLAATQTLTNKTLTSPTITGNLNMGSNNITTTGKMLFANMYAQEGDLPSATTYHGMFAHVHATGKGYFSHGGAWKKLIDEDSSTTNDLTEGTNLYHTDARVDARITATGCATTVNVSANNTDETVYLTFVNATGTQGIETNTQLTYNPYTGILTSDFFKGPLDGSCTGNAATATKIGSIVNSNIVQLSGAQTISGAKIFSGITKFTSSTVSSDNATGAVTVDGGVGILLGLHVGGDITAFSASDKRLKNNLEKINDPLDKLNKINGYTFDWIEKEGVHSNKGHDMGVIAQEIEEVLPEIVVTRENGYKAVRYEKMIPLLIETIKEQQKQINKLNDRLEILENKI